MARWLTGVSAIGALVLVYGVVVLDPWATLCGMTMAVGGKLWFVDRMVWLYQDVAETHPEFRAWLR